jgi:hypothetical protein
MWISEIAERSILTAMAALDVTFRASRVDDDEAAPTERKKYPCIVVRAGSGATVGTESLYNEVPCEVTIITHYEDDPKMAVLKGLEDEFHKILNVSVTTSTILTAFDAIATAAGETARYKGMTEIDGSMPEIVDAKQQSIMITMKFNVCGA